MTEPRVGRRAPRLRRATWKRRVQAALARRARTRENRSLAWRLLAPLVFLLAGALFVTSAISADGTDLRAGRFSDLSSLLRQQTEETDEARATARRLTEEVHDLSAQVGNGNVRQVQERAQLLWEPVGLVPVTGPGLTVTLDDAPEEVRNSADVEVHDLIVHQQDIQAVVNALWAGGAEAMTIQDQRVISTTGIKCVGNTVRLHGVPYAPPYVIAAVGNPAAMLTSLSSSPYIGIYRQYVEAYELGYEVEAHSKLVLPGYEGSTDLKYARPAGGSPSRSDGDDL